MKRWKKSKGIKYFLLFLLAAGLFLDVLSAMYMAVGKEYAGQDGENGYVLEEPVEKSLFISQEKTSELLDGYVRLFEEYMQIGNLITKDGAIDYDKEILCSLTGDKNYTIKELLKYSSAEGLGAGKLRDFMEDFAKNCEKGISYPWKSRYIMASDTRVILEGDEIYQFCSPNTKERTEKQIANMKKYRENMYAVTTDDVNFSEDFKDSVLISFPEEDWNYTCEARSIYEGYIITYFESYAKCYFLERMIESYKENGKELFLQVYNDFSGSGKREKTEEEFLELLEKNYEKKKEGLSESDIPWRIHLVPRKMEEARKYVIFLVETYQELKYLFSKSNFFFAYENSNGLLLTNHSEGWQKVKGMAESGGEIEKATDSTSYAFAYFNSRNDEGSSNLPEETLPMSGNLMEKMRSIGKNYNAGSYQIAVGIDLAGVMNQRQEDAFTQQYRETVEKSSLYNLGHMFAVVGGIVSAIVFLLLVVQSGGRVRNSQGQWEQEELFWYDRIWLEAQLLLGYLFGGMILWIIRLWNGLIIQPLIILSGIAITLLLYLMVWMLLSVIKRAKLHVGIRYSMLLTCLMEVLFGRVSLRNFTRKMAYQLSFAPTARKFGFLMVFEVGLLVYYLISAFYVLFDRKSTVLSYISSSFGVIGMVLGGIFLLVLLLWQRSSMQDERAQLQVIDALRKILQGDFSYQIPESEARSVRMQELVKLVNQIGAALEKAVEESVKNERMKTELIANVSHDIKTPLTSIINYVDLLGQEDIPGERPKKYLQVLEKKSLRLKVLMEDLIEASKASSGVLELDMQRLDLGELVRQTNGEFQERFAQCQLELISEIPAEPMYFEGDGRRVFRILENLYSNTAKYAMENTRVYVDVRREEEWAVFRIKNISARQLNITPEELTERFVRGDHARSTEGSGLGLSIAKSLAELMGGQLQLSLDGDLFCAQVFFQRAQ